MFTLTFEHIDARIAAIRNLPICELDQRQPLLVSLIADIVNAETIDGTLTMAAGNVALESMGWWLSLEGYLSGAGFKRLGEGHFSAAYKHPMLPGKVIKVGFKKEDSGAAYVAFCRMHQGLDGIPVIHDVQRHAGCYTVVLDELNEYRDSIVRGVGEAFEAAKDGLYALGYGYEDSPRHAGLFRTAKLIREFFLGIASFDLHGGNVMVDSKGNLVITDPVSFSADRDDTGICTCDVDKLLCEIEAKALKAVKDKARKRHERKADRAAFRKERRKERKVDAKRTEARKLLREAYFAECAQQERNAQRHFLNFGRTDHDNIFLEHPIAEMHDIFREKVMILKARDNWNCFNGLPLQIDNAMQARLMG